MGLHLKTLMTCLPLVHLLSPMGVWCAVYPQPFPASSSFLLNNTGKAGIINQRYLDASHQGLRSSAYTNNAQFSIASFSPQESTPATTSNVVTYFAQPLYNYPTTVLWGQAPYGVTAQVGGALIYSDVVGTAVDYGSASSTAITEVFGFRSDPLRRTVIHCAADAVVDTATGVNLLCGDGINALIGWNPTPSVATLNALSQYSIYSAVIADGVSRTLFSLTYTSGKLALASWSPNRLFDGAFHLVGIEYSRGSGVRNAQIFIDGQTSYSDGDYLQCMPRSEGVLPVKMKSLDPLKQVPSTLSGAVYTGGQFVVGVDLPFNGSNTTLPNTAAVFNLVSQGTLLAQRQIIAFGTPAMYQYDLGDATFDIVYGALVLCVFAILMIDVARQYYSEIVVGVVDPLENVEADNQAFVDTEGAAMEEESNGAPPAAEAANDESPPKKRERRRSVARQARTAAEGAEAQQHLTQVAALAVGQVQGAAANLAQVRAGANQTAQTDAPTPPTPSLGEQMEQAMGSLKNLLCTIPIAVSALQFLQTMFAGITFPERFQLYAQYVTFWLGVNISLPAFELPPYLTLVLLTTIGIACGMLFVIFFRRDTQKFEGSVQRYQAALVAYERLIAAHIRAEVFGKYAEIDKHASPFASPVETQATSLEERAAAFTEKQQEEDVMEAAHYLAYHRRGTWTYTDLQAILPTMLQSDVKAKNLAVRLSVVPENAVDATIMRFAVEHRILGGLVNRSTEVANAIAASSRVVNVLQLVRVHAGVSLSMRRAVILAEELRELASRPTVATSCELAPEVLERLSRLAGVSKLPDPSAEAPPTACFDIALTRVQDPESIPLDEDKEPIFDGIPTRLVVSHETQEWAMLETELRNTLDVHAEHGLSAGVARLIARVGYPRVDVDGSLVSKSADKDLPLRERLVELRDVKIHRATGGDLKLQSIELRDNEDDDTLMFTLQIGSVFRLPERDQRTKRELANAIYEKHKRETQQQHDSAGEQNVLAGEPQAQPEAEPTTETSPKNDDGSDDDEGHILGRDIVYKLDLNWYFPLQCPRHHVHVVTATEDHYRVINVAGRQAYRCCQDDGCCFKESRPNTSTCANDSLLVCPNRECAYAVCTTCADPYMTPLSRGRLAAETQLYTFLQDPAAILGAVAFLGLQSVFVPAAQGSLMFLFCHPSVRCDYPGCYQAFQHSADSSAHDFFVGFSLSIFLLTVMVVVTPIVWFITVVTRFIRLRHVIDTSAQWAWFLALDDSVLSNLYRKYEFRFMMLEPFFLFSQKGALVAAVAFCTPNSLAQLTAIAVIMCVNALFLAFADPFTDPWMDILTKASLGHQLAQLALLSFHNYITRNDPTNQDMAYLMFLVFVVYIIFALVIIVKTGIVPFVSYLRYAKGAAITRRERTVLDTEEIRERRVRLYSDLLKVKEDFYGDEHFQLCLTLANLVADTYPDVVAFDRFNEAQSQLPPMQRRLSVHDEKVHRARGINAELHRKSAERCQRIFAELMQQSDLADELNMPHGFGDKPMSLWHSTTVTGLVMSLKPIAKDLYKPLLAALYLGREDVGYATVSANAFTLLSRLGFDFVGMDLRDAALYDCEITGALLENVDLRNADLRRATFLDTMMSRTRLDGCTTHGAVFGEPREVPFEALLDFKTPKESESFITVDPSNSIIALASGEDVRLLEAATGRETSTVSPKRLHSEYGAPPKKPLARHVAVLRSGTVLVAVDASVYAVSQHGDLLQPPMTRESSGCLQGDVSDADLYVSALTPSADGRWVAVGYSDTRVTLFRLASETDKDPWRASSFTKATPNSSMKDSVLGQQDCPPSVGLWTALARENITDLLEAELARVMQLDGVFPSNKQRVNTLAISPSGSEIAVGRRGSPFITMLDFWTGAVKRDIHAGGRGSPDHFLSGSVSIELNSTKVDKSFNVRSVRCLAFDATASFLAVAVDARAHAINVIDPKGGKLLLRLMGHTAPVNHVAVAARGATVASFSDDGTVRLWNSTTGTCADVIKSVSGGAIAQGTLTSDGQRLLFSTARVDNHASVVDLVMRRMSRPNPDSTAPAVMCIAVESVDVGVKPRSPALVAFGDESGFVALRSADAGLRVAYWAAYPANRVASAAFCADNSLVVTASEAGEVRVWDVEERTAKHKQYRLGVGTGDDAEVALLDQAQVPNAVDVINVVCTGDPDLPSDPNSASPYFVVSVAEDKSVSLWCGLILRRPPTCERHVIYSYNPPPPPPEAADGHVAVPVDTEEHLRPGHGDKPKASWTATSIPVPKPKVVNATEPTAFSFDAVDGVPTGAVATVGSSAKEHLAVCMTSGATWFYRPRIFTATNTLVLHPVTKIQLPGTWVGRLISAIAMTEVAPKSGDSWHVAFGCSSTTDGDITATAMSVFNGDGTAAWTHDGVLPADAHTLTSVAATPHGVVASAACAPASPDPLNAVRAKRAVAVTLLRWSKPENGPTEATPSVEPVRAYFIPETVIGETDTSSSFENVAAAKPLVSNIAYVAFDDAATRGQTIIAAGASGRVASFPALAATAEAGRRVTATVAVRDQWRRADDANYEKLVADATENRDEAPPRPPDASASCVVFDAACDGAEMKITACLGGMHSTVDMTEDEDLLIFGQGNPSPTAPVHKTKAAEPQWRVLRRRDGNQENNQDIVAEWAAATWTSEAPVYFRQCSVSNLDEAAPLARFY